MVQAKQRKIGRKKARKAKARQSMTNDKEQNIALQCPKLTETNYTTWAIMMETILKAYGIWEAIEVKEGDKANEKRENTSKAMIFQTLPQDVLMQVAQYSTAKEVWESIKVKYLGADLVQKARLQTLRSELETLRMKPDEKVSDFGGKLSSIKAKFKSLGGNLKDKVLVRKLLNSVPKKFLPIVASIEQYQEIDTMPFEEAIGRITAFEERLKSQDEHEENHQDKLLMASSRNQGHERGRGRNFNKERGTYRGERDKSDRKCYKCDNYGHLSYDCTKWKEKDNNEKSHSNKWKDKKEESLLAYYSDEDAPLL